MSEKSKCSVRVSPRFTPSPRTRVHIPHTVGKTRSADANKRRVLDEGTRKRRHQRHLESLEKDNFHDDPHAAFAHLAAKTKLPAFSDGSESGSAKVGVFAL